MTAGKHRLPIFPPMRCDDGCGDCCGPVPVTRDELGAVRRYIEREGIKAVDRGALTCPFYDGRCTIYPVRPFICRAFGHTPRLKCSRGYNTNISDRQVTMAIVARGPAVGLLHSLISVEVAAGTVEVAP